MTVTASGTTDNLIYGGGSGDLLIAGDGLDKLYGGGGADSLDGGSGTDSLTGGLGDDTMTGGSGADRFLKIGGEGSDTITDFVGGQDKVDLTTITVSSGLGSSTVLFSDGSSVFASNAYLWQASDFV
jgi:serralysin